VTPWCWKIKNPTIFPQNEKINSRGLCVSKSVSVHVYASLMFLPLKWPHYHHELFSHVCSKYDQIIWHSCCRWLVSLVFNLHLHIILKRIYLGPLTTFVWIEPRNIKLPWHNSYFPQPNYFKPNKTMLNIQTYIATWYHVLHDLDYVGHPSNCIWQIGTCSSKQCLYKHVMFVIIGRIVVVFNDEFVLPIIIKICKVLGEFILWCTQKKLSQFNNFLYLFKFDASWWIFGKYFVMKICNGWWYMFNSIIMLWN